MPDEIPPSAGSEFVEPHVAEYILYAVTTFVSAVIGAIFVILAFPDQPTSFLISGFGVIIPLFVMPAVTLMTYRMGNMRGIVPKRLNIRIPAAIVAVCLAFLLVSLILGLAFPGSSPPSTEANIEPKPPASGLPPGTYIGAFLTLNSSVLVETGQVLQLVNSTVVMNLSADRGAGIWVDDGGILFMTNTTVSAAQPAHRYTFEIMGSARIERSVISGVWSNSQQQEFDGGLEIYSSDVVVDGTSFPAPSLNGIFIMNADPTITNNSISDAGDDGIEMHNSEARIIGNTISRCEFAMMVSQGSDALIEGNIIVDNAHGIVVEASSPQVRLNRFENNKNYAIGYDGRSHLTLDGNIFVNNEHDLVEQSGYYILGACGVITVALAIGCLYVLSWIHREQSRKDIVVPRGPTRPGQL